MNNVDWGVYMAQNGGEALRRVSASAASRLAVTARSQSPPPLARRDFITLEQPRPGSARALNEYIDTPKLPIPKGKPRNASGTSEDLTLNRPSLLREHSQISSLTTTSRSSQVPIITSQPSISLKKEQQSDSGDSTESHRDSIICQECGRCKCDACTTPRPLPSKWICNDKCLCSAETTLDYCTCVCCIKGVFYHCAKDYDLDNDVACADDPCSCSPHRRCLRWGCMGSVALFLPCLWCYWPMKGCLKLCTACYSRYHYPGCRCRRKALELASRKGLLDSNSDC